MRNKRKLLNMLLCTVMAFAITATGCSAEKTDEARWNETENVIDAESVDGDADYSKFEEKKEKKDSKETKESEKETALEEETVTSDNKKDDSKPAKDNNKGNTESKEADELTCTISISCSTILNNMGNLTEGKESIVPSNGVILGTMNVEFEEGETVFDVLYRVTRNKGIHMEYVDTPAYNSAYIEGLANLYEKDCGGGSGWMYCVNGWYPDYGCSQYDLEDGDVIQWNYTCDLGRDLGQSF